MGLLDTLKQVKQEGFNAETDSIATNSKLAAGKYPVRFKSSQVSVDKASRTQLGIALEVVSGKDKGRMEFIYLSFDEGLPEFVLNKNGRTLLKLASMLDIEFTNKDLADEVATNEALSKGIGKQFEMDLTIAANKKNPDFPYRNYDFKQLISELDDSIDEDELDLPF
ncbi:hypothetical protein LHA31_02690 [Carnobacterium viridans]|uniref:Uncharacterized protein n=1 Tax=Carnobacterium viridans TaxID=174587 RepID=A0A1H1BQ19_9LACT|nr:hypothetical protein [Carnobacterium viridans]UDE95703.1 hypothetical protein LHA31_02690 [Carnobacterium viridans]SDQ53830.1 hypothetical protein SAMN04487752_2679 [Carnobacterium viridans]SDQ55280.1 hypothetical protein SAMN04487752_2739 [Carnobacterium viridans]